MNYNDMTHGDNLRVSKLESDVDRQTEINQTILDGLREVRDTIKDPERGNMALHNRLKPVEDFRKRIVWTVILISGIVTFGVGLMEHVWPAHELSPQDVATIVREVIKETKP